MIKRSLLIVLFIVNLVALSSCGIAKDLGRAVKGESATPSPTFTATQMPSLTPTFTPIPTYTPTITNTPTPVKGSFENPYLLGETTDIIPFGNIRYSDDEFVVFANYRFTLLEVKTGEEANQQARTSMSFYYQTPIEQQEYLAFYGTIEVVDSDDMNDTQAAFPNWSFTLRYEENGDDFTTVEVLSEVNEFDSGYPPFSRTGWFFFLVREDTRPYLYFQPLLALTMEAGDMVRDRGVYIDPWSEQ